MPSTSLAPFSSPNSHPPRVRSWLPFDRTLGGAAADVIDQLNHYELDPWQRDALAVACAIDQRLRWRFFEVVLRLSRQNGKGDVIQAREVLEATLVASMFGPRIVRHTAHELETAEDAHARLVALIDIAPALQRRVANVTNQNGKKNIEWRNGSVIKYRSRSGRGGRGLQGDLIVLDEDLYLEASMLGAVIPTLLSRDNCQVLYAGSGLLPTSSQAHAVRRRALVSTDPDPQLAYMEYSAPEGSHVWDRTVWPLANPALAAGRLTEAKIAKSIQALGEEEGAREHLCISESTAKAAVIPDGAWADLADKSSEIPHELPVQYCLDVDEDGTHAAIGVAGRRADGLWHLEVADRGDGIQWCVPWLRQRRRRVGTVWLTPGAVASGLMPDLIAAGVDVHVATPREHAAACGRMYDLTVERGEVRHIDQPGLNSSVAAGRKRYTKDAWVFHRRDPLDDLTSLNAVTIALYAASLDYAKPRQVHVPTRAEDFLDDSTPISQLRW